MGTRYAAHTRFDYLGGRVKLTNTYSAVPDLKPLPNAHVELSYYRKVGKGGKQHGKPAKGSWRGD